jgi:hypothetical protein
MTAKPGVRRVSLIVVLAAFIVSLGLASTAFAISIDFADGSWNGAQGTSSFTTHPSGIDLFANVGTLTVQADGLGIGDDEIGSSGLERLTITFAAQVTLQTVLLTNLFPNEGLFGCCDEGGAYSLNGGLFTNTFSSGGSSGDRTLTINQSGITSIAFRSNFDLFSDYSVRGLTYSTPEPSAVLLLGSAMLSLAFSMKRFSGQS